MKKTNKTLLVAVLLFVLSLLLDRKIAIFLRMIKNPVFDLFFGWITDFTTLFIFFILATTLFLISNKNRRYAIPLWASFLSSVAISFILKLVVARARPVEFFYIINALDYSFPSMHAMIVFSALPILNKKFQKLKWVWLAFAFLVAFSRLYFGFHFLSDVVFGAFFGYFIGIFLVDK
ncbi:phosphatase PAP2 family protein [Candidatus Woesearchaeota archaeon]|nr:phosphatase PAP2 family protein [Candidatus Woesearchaeota archaeon]